jgi:hypothetical protein
MRLKQSIVRLYEGLARHDCWNVGLARQPIEAFLESGSQFKVHWFPAPRPGTFLADPFAVRTNDTIHVLCEEFNYWIGSGRIVSMDVEPEGPSFGQLIPIDWPVRTHASYPFLLEYRGDIYCVPETWQLREISLYRAREFPTIWEKDTTLIANFAGLDPTIFEHEGHWWLACTNKHDEPLAKLVLWHAEDLRGPWKPHMANPVKNDIFSSRPAGTPFKHHGLLYRPAQDNSKTYGGRVVINRITKLTPTEFQEVVSAVVEPQAGSPWTDGIHTVCDLEDLTLIDGKKLRFIKAAFRNTVLKNLRKLNPYDKSQGLGS